jgi:DNA repair photolyase
VARHHRGLARRTARPGLTRAAGIGRIGAARVDRRWPEQIISYADLVRPRDVHNPPNRFHSQVVAYDEGEGPPPVPVTLIDDRSRSILSENDSPDLGFRWSVNPYRGCQHACAYCYARPTHEYLDLGAGTDFDTKIIVKRDAPELLRAAFDRPSWQGELVMFSGVTDCYQPAEKELELTRRCLEVCLEYRNPVSVISKSALVERDLDIFVALAREARFHMSVSLAFTDGAMARAIEPWAPSPDRRFKVIETMARAGVPVGVMCAPIIPGLNDSQMVGLLERAAAAGATTAGWTLLRLPGAVKQVFEERIREGMPLAADKILHRIRETRGGEKLYDSRFHVRGRGQGPYAEFIATMFASTVTRLGLNERRRDKTQPMMMGTAPAGQADLRAEGEPDGDDDDEPTTFRRPPRATNQLSLFGG